MKTGSYTRRNQIQIQTIAETSKIKIKKYKKMINTQIKVNISEI